MRGDVEIADAVRAAAEARAPLRIVGRGSWLHAGHSVPASEQLDLSADSGVVAYTPGDLTITVRAGTTLAEIETALREREQWLPLDPEGGADVTIGATVATCSHGPSAPLFGTPRDQVLGMTVITGTGDALHVGGRVVKNVAGFDLTRLMIGAWGTLGVITEITLRVRSRGMRRGSIVHMRRDYRERYGHREPILTHAALSLALKQRFDPHDILNRGIMRAPE